MARGLESRIKRLENEIGLLPSPEELAEIEAAGIRLYMKLLHAYQRTGYLVKEEVNEVNARSWMEWDRSNPKIIIRDRFRSEQAITVDKAAGIEPDNKPLVGLGEILRVSENIPREERKSDLESLRHFRVQIWFQPASPNPQPELEAALLKEEQERERRLAEMDKSRPEPETKPVVEALTPDQVDKKLAVSRGKEKKKPAEHLDETQSGHRWVPPGERKKIAIQNSKRDRREQNREKYKHLYR